jgi:hypothetical protein
VQGLAREQGRVRELWFEERQAQSFVKAAQLLLQ